jgi:hypothetical protein
VYARHQLRNWEPTIKKSTSTCGRVGWEEKCIPCGGGCAGATHGVPRHLRVLSYDAGRGVAGGGARVPEVFAERNLKDGCRRRCGDIVGSPGTGYYQFDLEGIYRAGHFHANLAESSARHVRRDEPR